MTIKTKPDYGICELTGAVKNAVILLTEAHAANRLNISQGTLRNARSTGSLGLPFIKLTPTKRGRIRYRESDIVAFINARTYLNTHQACPADNGGAV